MSSMNSANKPSLQHGPQGGADEPTRRHHRSSLKFRLLAGFMMTVLMFVGAELSLRLANVGNDERRFRQMNEIVRFLGTHESDLMMQPDSERFWKLKPNVRIEDEGNEFWKGRVSNSLGFRNSEFEIDRRPNMLRIVCFGDSSTFGIGNRMIDTWPSQLQQRIQGSSWASRYTTIEVINAGVPGYSSFQGLQHLRQEIGRLNPDIVLASYANNDFWHWDNTTDASHHEKFQSNSVRNLLLKSRIAQLLDAGISSMRPQPDVENLRAPSPNQTWAHAATVNYVSPVPEWVRRVPLSDFRVNMERMASLCEQHNAKCIFVQWPDQPLAAGQGSPRLEYHAVLHEVAQLRGLELADVVSEFQRHRPWSVNTYIPNDIVHVNHSGNALAAQAAFEAICRTLQIEVVPPQSTN